MPDLSIRLIPESAPILDALANLSTLSKAFPDSVQRFLDGLLDPSELVCLDVGNGPAGSAGEFRIALQPSDRLLEFLATFPAGNVE